MKIVSSESNYHNLVNIGNKIALQKEVSITFIAESKEDGNEIMKVANKFLGIKGDD